MSATENLPWEEVSAIVAACERLSLDYAYFADRLRVDEWAGLFAEDAELVTLDGVHSGRAAIKAALTRLVTLHIITNIRINPLGMDEAEGSAYITWYIRPSEDTPPAITPDFVGIYSDRYRRTSEGWRFVRRTVEPFVIA